MEEGNGYHILLVDDEEQVRSIASELLEKLGFAVYAADSGPNGLDYLERNAGRVHAVVLDLSMPGMSGAGVLARIIELYPRLPVVLTSGYSEETESLPVKVEDGARYSFMPKPFTARSLREAIEAALVHV
jgi:CheY-like chemotaxis protein